MPLAQAAGAWVHVDGAFGLWARACPATAHLAAGIEAADSWATDGHKWLQMPYDCGYRHRARRASASPRHDASPRAICRRSPPASAIPSHYVPELSRRARGFADLGDDPPLGRAGVAELVEHHCALARRMAQALLAREPGSRC